MTSDRDDPHGVLGVARTATPAQISHAYRDLLRRHHPDTRTPEDDEAHDLALREVLDAYADLHARTRSNGFDRDQPVERPAQRAEPQTQPIPVLGHVDPRHMFTPTWIRDDGNGADRPTAITLLIAFLEALSPEPW